MSVAAREDRRYSLAQYLELENAASEKHEYRDGELLDMAGASYNHGLITVNLIHHLVNLLDGKPCRALNSDVRVRVARMAFFAYPDASVVCGEPQFDPDDRMGQSLLNPRAIIEVISPSTEAYDRGDKFTRYRCLESLEEYLLVSQKSAEIEAYFRQSDGTWLFSSAMGLDARIRLRSLQCELPLANVYAGVEFPPTPAVP